VLRHFFDSSRYTLPIRFCFQLLLTSNFQDSYRKGKTKKTSTKSKKKSRKKKKRLDNSNCVIYNTTKRDKSVINWEEQTVKTISYISQVKVKKEETKQQIQNPKKKKKKKKNDTFSCRKN
jgi:hypothetical protein